jgi:hypothetical protein
VSEVSEARARRQADVARADDGDASHEP